LNDQPENHDPTALFSQMVKSALDDPNFMLKSSNVQEDTSKYIVPTSVLKSPVVNIIHTNEITSKRSRTLIDNDKINEEMQAKEQVKDTAEEKMEIISVPMEAQYTVDNWFAEVETKTKQFANPKNKSKQKTKTSPNSPKKRKTISDENDDENIHIKVKPIKKVKCIQQKKEKEKKEKKETKEKKGKREKKEKKVKGNAKEEFNLDTFLSPEEIEAATRQLELLA